MDILGTIFKIITFPFRVILGLFRKKEDTNYPNVPPPTQYPSQYTAGNQAYPAGEPNMENMKAKFDLVVTQMDSMKIENEAMDQRLQNIERMVREIYAMAKS